MARARGMDGHGHREATRQEHKRHGCAEIRFESMTSRCEPGVIKRPVHDVAGEDATKKEHFRSEKDPHAEIAGVALLSDVLRSEEHTSELQSPVHLVCRLLLEKKKELY